MSCYLRPTVVIAIAGTVMLAPLGHLAAAPPVRRPAPQGPTIVRLAVDPAAEPRPALKYTFLTPRPREARQRGPLLLPRNPLLHHIGLESIASSTSGRTCPSTSFRETKCGRSSMAL